MLGRRFDGTGEPKSEPFRVARRVQADASSLLIAIGTTGCGLATWTTSEPDGLGRVGRRVDKTGRPYGPALTIISAEEAAILGTGRALSAHRRDHYLLAGTTVVEAPNDNQIWARAIRRRGRIVGPHVIVNTVGPGRRLSRDASPAANRSYVVVWAPTSQDTGILGRRVSRRGRTLGTEIQMNSFAPGPHSTPRVASDSIGNFVVVWRQGEYYDYYFPEGSRCGSGDDICQDGSGSGIVARAFDPTGAAMTDDQVLSGEYDQINPYVGVNDAGRFVVAWTDVECAVAENYYCRYSYGADGSGDSVDGATGTTGP